MWGTFVAEWLIWLSSKFTCPVIALGSNPPVVLLSLEEANHRDVPETFPQSQIFFHKAGTRLNRLSRWRHCNSTNYTMFNILIFEVVNSYFLGILLVWWCPFWWILLYSYICCCHNSCLGNRADHMSKSLENETNH